MKSLLFCPLFLSEGERLQRNLKWIDYIFSIKQYLHFDEILMVDNASNPEDLLKFENHIEQYRKQVPITIIKCKTRLFRRTEHSYGFWYSAFGKAARFAKENGFDKIAHVDSDVYLLNKRICDYVNDFKEGWLAFWCQRHNYPETTFQLIGKDKFDEMYEFMTRDFLEFYPNDIAETRIPWTHVEKGFNGDRFGEGRDVQRSEHEWYGQCPVDIVLRFNK